MVVIVVVNACKLRFIVNTIMAIISLHFNKLHHFNTEYSAMLHHALDFDGHYTTAMIQLVC